MVNLPSALQATTWQASSVKVPPDQFLSVYILVSESDSSCHYTGITINPRGRLAEHNRGSCLHTAKHRPWRIETAVAFRSEMKHVPLKDISRVDRGGLLRAGIFDVSPESSQDSLDSRLQFFEM
jgi:hypothetical protein